MGHQNGGCLVGAAEGFSRPKGSRELGLISAAENGFRELVAAFIGPLKEHRDTVDEKSWFTVGKKKKTKQALHAQLDQANSSVSVSLSLSLPRIGWLIQVP